MEPWRDRRVGSGVKPAKDFLDNPLNYRIHTHLQEEAMDAILDEIGWVDDVKENVTTGHLVNGHMRVSRAYLRDPHEPVPVTYIELTEEEERKVLLTFDFIGTMIERDSAKVATLLADTRASDARLEALLTDLRDSVKPLTFAQQPSGAHYAEHPLADHAVEQQPSVRDAVAADPSNPPTVRHFHMFLNGEQYAFFMNGLKELAQRYQTENATDTLLAAIEELCANA
jgi:hypothetical protein